jgi:hypothetical protein
VTHSLFQCDFSKERFVRFSFILLQQDSRGSMKRGKMAEARAHKKIKKLAAARLQGWRRDQLGKKDLFVSLIFFSQIHIHPYSSIPIIHTPNTDLCLCSGETEYQCVRIISSCAGSIFLPYSSSSIVPVRDQSLHPVLSNPKQASSE